VRARRAQERLDLGEVSEDELALNRRSPRSRFLIVRLIWRVVVRGTFPNAGPRQRERNEQRRHRADRVTVSRCARPVGVSKRHQD